MDRAWAFRYRGPAAWSELETQYIRDLVIAEQPRVALNFHSYGDMVFHPFGYTLEERVPQRGCESQESQSSHILE